MDKKRKTKSLIPITHFNRGEASKDALEDYALFFEAEKRMAAANNTLITESEMLSRLGINKTELDDVEVELKT